jgi:D-tyrosyl-tRNA(Tyr) deacylase
VRAVVQRVSRACVTVDGRTVGEVGRGLLVLCGIHGTDTAREREWMADKIVNLRIVPDDRGMMNQSVLELARQCAESASGAAPECPAMTPGWRSVEAGAGVLLVPNFTVAGDARKGRRPSFDGAMKPPEAREAFEALVEAVRALAVQSGASGLRVETGRFGADMRVELVNDGPVTIVLETEKVQ